ncbi:MAG: division/cell wall cluster transcriptional repressor MraZ [Burkholderiales bacterium]|jgi:MraZ protein|nr:division/cell wall cluster transcriptional repressor MraZ [Burkholderiales bacterium]
MFRGATALSLDAKGRLAVPARHREALQVQGGGRLVLTAHPHRCLLLYPQPEWEPIQEKIMALPSLDKQASLLQRLLVGFAEDVEMDGAGRVLISPVLREFAGLEKQVMLVGQGSHFEVWSEASWRAQLEEALAQGDRVLPPELGNLAL